MPVHAAVPMQSIGPLKLLGPHIEDEVMVPMATYESPLWPSTNRGAKACRLAGGIKAVVLQDKMTRSVLIEAKDIFTAQAFLHDLPNHLETLKRVVRSHSRFTHFLNYHTQTVGNLIYIRFEFSTGDASGHNMATAAAEHLLNWILNHYVELKYLSISGNYCSDKKATAVNGILGRGKYTVAEVILSREICQDVLKTTPEKIVELNIKKNLIGTLVAGGLRSANAHFANMLLAFYLATGQDAANIVEGSQGITHAEVRPEGLYFSVTLPNLIMGTIGNGKDLPFVQENLQALGCLAPRDPGKNAKRLACIMAGTILCGELSLMAAQTNPGELMRTHVALERNKQAHTAEAVDG